MRWRQRAAGWAATLCVACLGLVPASSGATSAGAFDRATPPDHAAFDRILHDNVRAGRVDYLTIRDECWDDLTGYLDRMATVDPAALASADRLAFYLNVYNATVIRAVAERLQVGYAVSANHFALFDEPIVKLAGGPVSLNVLERDRLRAGFHDPRIHAALVCAAVSCPPLAPRAYTGADLDSMLEARMQAFVNDTTRNRVDARTKTLSVSAIFDWYADDFAPQGGVLALFHRFRPGDYAGDSIAFLPYDWSLNLARASLEAWCRVTSEEAELHRDGANGPVIDTIPRGGILRVIGKSSGDLRVARPFGAGPAWVSTGDTAPYAPTTP